jgi:hypothetical protein
MEGSSVPGDEVESETERLRQYVIAAREDPWVAAEAEACLAWLNALRQQSPDLFTEEDVGSLNVFRGRLGARLEAHKGGGPYAPIAKPKGTRLDHCWRCETPLDERFTEECPACWTKGVKSLVCPVCQACRCQAAGTVLV